MYGQNHDYEQIAEHYFEKYRDQVEVFESNCVKARCNMRVEAQDIAVLGEKLQQWEDYVGFCESQGSLADLGTIPNLALDIIAASEVQSIVPLVASNQTIPDLNGTVYVKTIRAVNAANTNGASAGGVADGSQLFHAQQGNRVHNEGYGSGRKISTAASPLATTVIGTATYNIALQSTLLPFTLDWTYEEAGVITKIKDDGEGQIMSTRGVSGTINYDTGAITLNFDTAPAAAGPILGTVDIDVEREPDMTTISSSYEGIPVSAEFFGLKMENGLLSQFAMSKRWGKTAEDDVAQDLVNELVTTMNAACVSRLNQAANSSAHLAAVNWNPVTPAGISAPEHKLSFSDTMSQLEKNLKIQAGKGTVNRFVVGEQTAAYMRAMPDWVAAPNAAQFEVGLYGYLGGVPVIRGSTQQINDTDFLALHVGDGGFNAPLVAATYLPLFVTSTLHVGANPLRNQRAVATMTALKAVSPRMIARGTTV